MEGCSTLVGRRKLGKQNDCQTLITHREMEGNPGSSWKVRLSPLRSSNVEAEGWMDRSGVRAFHLCIASQVGAETPF